MSSDATPQPSKLVQTALAAIDGYNKWDIDLILAPRSPDCLFYTLPASLGRPTRSNDEYRQFFAGLIPLFQHFTLHVLDITEDQARNRVVLHARSTAETKIGPYANEYMLTFVMTEDQAQVRRIEEFVDSAFSGEFFARLVGREAMGRKGEAVAEVGYGGG